MKLVELLATTDTWVSSWQTHPWQCWPPETRIIHWHKDDLHLASAVFDLDSNVLALEVFNSQGTQRWIESQYHRVFLDECHAQGIDPTQDELGPVKTVSMTDILRSFLASFGPAAALNT